MLLNLFGVKKPQTDKHQAADLYLMSCHLRDPSVKRFNYFITVYTVDWQVSSEECESSELDSHSHTFSHWANF